MTRNAVRLVTCGLAAIWGGAVGVGWSAGGLAEAPVFAGGWALGIIIAGGISLPLLGLGAVVLASLLVPAGIGGAVLAIPGAAFLARLAIIRRAHDLPRWDLALMTGAATVLATLFSGSSPSAPLLASGLSVGAVLVLVPRRGRPVVDTACVLNSLVGHGIFISVCSLAPLLLPLTGLVPRRQRLALVAGGLAWGCQQVMRWTPAVAWRFKDDARLMDHSAIIISNHESILDILTMLTLPGRPRALLAKSWVFRTPFLGVAARAGGMVPLDLLEPGALGCDPAVALASGRCLVVFPEGSRSRDGRLLRFRSGAFAAAQLLNLPLVLAVQAGTGRMARAGTAWIRPGNLSTTVAPFVPTGAGPRADARAAQQQIIALRDHAAAELLGLCWTRLERLGQLAHAGWRFRLGAIREEYHGYWRVAALIAPTDPAPGPVIFLGCGWNTLPIALRQLAAWTCIMAQEGHAGKRAMTGAWWQPGDVVVDYISDLATAHAVVVLDATLPPRELPALCRAVVPAAVAEAWAACTRRRVQAILGTPLVQLLAASPSLVPVKQ